MKARQVGEITALVKNFKKFVFLSNSDLNKNFNATKYNLSIPMQKGLKAFLRTETKSCKI